MEYLTNKCIYTMDELRRQREVLMTERLELIARHRKLSNKAFIKPYLISAKPPTPPPAQESVKSMDGMWIKSILTSLVYDAVREVEVSQPYRKKLEFYSTLSKDYETFVENIIAKSVKQTIVTEMFNELWREVTNREISRLVKQCIGDLDLSGTLASSLILQSIIKVNRQVNMGAPEIPNELVVCKNLMSEICLERNKLKSDRHLHKLHLHNLIEVADKSGQGDTISREESDLVFEGTVLSALKTFDIQCLERTYLPALFDGYSSAEVALWQSITSEPVELVDSSSIITMSLSSSMQYAAISSKGYVSILRCFDNLLITKHYIEVHLGDCIAIDWMDSEVGFVFTTSLGFICFVELFSVKTPTTAQSTKASRHQAPRKSTAMSHVITPSNLMIVSGLLAQTKSEIRHVPVKALLAPIYTLSGEQPVFLVICKNHAILRVCRDTPEPLFLPEDIPEFEDIKNTTKSGLKVDVCRGHRAGVSHIVFKDEYVFLSVDEQCVIIEWEYSRDCFDAYGYVIPKKFIVKGNDLDYSRLVKGLVNHFNSKKAKTRQEVMQATKVAEKVFSEIGYGNKPTSTRENLDTGLQEKTFVKSVNLSGDEYEVQGSVVINKTIGRGLVVLKSQMFKQKNCAPSQLLGVCMSPCASLLACTFLFLAPLYGGAPYLSTLLLRTHNYSFLKNKVKLPLTPQQVAILTDSPHLFTSCLSPPHYVTKSSYLVLKIDRSLLLISTATSNVVRTSIDLMSLSCDNSKFISEKNSQCIQGPGTIHCNIWDKYLIVYGDNSKKVLAFSLNVPEELEDRYNLFLDISRSRCLTKWVDPEGKRLLVYGDKCWGRVHEGFYQTECTFKFIKDVVKSHLFSKLDSL